MSSRRPLAERRAFFAPPTDLRCCWDTTMRDGSGAQCMRRAVEGRLCRQHAKMLSAMNFECCGGNDELPPSHCADCPTTKDSP